MTTAEATTKEEPLPPARAAVLVNLAANNNSAEAKWKRIQTKVLGTLPANTTVITYRPPFDLKACIGELHESQKISCFISAGGDGTLNCVLNVLINFFAQNPCRPFLGAIGLGSSNDYHKPFSSTCLGVPVKIDMTRSILTDVGQVEYVLGSAKSIRYFLTGAGMGLVAEANRLFNDGDTVIALLKHRSVNTSILYTAMKTILTYRNVPATVEYNNSSCTFSLTNLNLIKTPHVSGGFQYDSPIQRADGHLGFHLCHGMGTIQRLKVLYDLSNKRFSGKPGRVSALVRAASMSAHTPMALETDGEIQLASSAVFSVNKQQLLCLC
jgi:diacylglycerol kinase (ATP)